MAFAIEVEEDSDQFLHHTVIASIDTDSLKTIYFDLVSVFCCGTLLSPRHFEKTYFFYKKAYLFILFLCHRTIVTTANCLLNRTAILLPTTTVLHGFILQKDYGSPHVDAGYFGRRKIRSFYAHDKYLEEPSVGTPQIGQEQPA